MTSAEEIMHTLTPEDTAFLEQLNGKLAFGPMIARSPSYDPANHADQPCPGCAYRCGQCDSNTPTEESPLD